MGISHLPLIYNSDGSHNPIQIIHLLQCDGHATILKIHRLRKLTFPAGTVGRQSTLPYSPATSEHEG